MPVDITAEYIRVRQHPPGRYDQFRNTPLSKEKGIYKIDAKVKGQDKWEIQSLLFAKVKGWSVTKAKQWISEHEQFTWPGTQSETKAIQESGIDEVSLNTADFYMTQDEEESDNETPLTKTEPIDITAKDLPKYVEVRQHPPSHFSSYQHQYLDRARGIIKSVRKWRKTGAVAVQKLLFRRDHGWTEESVKEWFKEHSEFRHPEVSMVQEVRDTLIDVPCTLQLLPDSDNDKAFTVFDVIILRGGFGKNFRLGADGRRYQDYFTSEFLQSLVPLLEGTAVQSVKLDKGDNGNSELPDGMKAVLRELKRHGHPPDIINLFYDLGLSGNAIGLLKDVEYQEFHNEVVGDELIDGAVDRGKFHLAAGSPHAEHSRRLFQLAWQQGLKKSLGLSVNYRANAEFTEIDGRPAFKFTQATRHVSTETVINPAAGGGIVRVLQGVQEIMDNEKEARVQEAEETPVPDEKEQLELAVTQAEEPEVKQDEPKSAPPSEQPIEKTEEPASQNQDVTALQQQVVALTGMVQSLTEGMQVHGSALQIIEDEKRKTALRFMVSQSQLPVEAKNALTTQIDEGKLNTIDNVNLAIMTGEKTQEAIYAKQSAPVFPGLSGIHTEVLKDPTDVMKIRSKLNWELPLTQAEQELATKYGIKRFNGITDEYIALTGDIDKTMHYNPQHFIKRIHPELVQHSARVQDDGTSFTQTVLTTTYSDFLTHVINRSLEAHYRATDKTWQKFVKVGDPYSDNKDHDEWLLGQFPEIAVVAQSAAYQEISYGKLEKMVSSSVKYGNLFKVTEEVIQDDNLGYVKAGIQLFSDAMNRTVYRKVMDLALAFSTTVNGATMADTTAGTLYNYANRKNYINGGSDDFDKIVELIGLMMSQVDLMDDAGGEAPLAIQPWIFAAEIMKIGAVKARVKGPYEPGRSDNLPNTLYMQNIPDDNFVGIHKAYLYEHPEILIVLPNPQIFAGLGMKYFKGLETPEFTWEGNQSPAYGSAFSNDVLQLRLKFKFRLFYQRLKAFYALFEMA